MPAPPTDPAPVPWLGAEARDVDANAQPWRPAQERIVLLALRYAPAPTDHWRCYSRMVWTRPYTIALFLFFSSLMPTTQGWIGYLTNSVSTKQWGTPKWSLILAPLIGIFSFTIVSVLARTLYTVSHVFHLSRFRGFQNAILATTHGVEDTTAKQSEQIKWSDVAGIVLFRGDVFVHGKMIDSGVYVPRTAFADADTAKRFHPALTALWKTKGNPEAVPETVRAEFAPDHDAMPDELASHHSPVRSTSGLAT